jgi:hypothetical protein
LTVLLVCVTGACTASPVRPIPVLSVDTTQAFQRITGWEATAQLGEVDCNPVAFTRYRDEVVHRLVNELGITRLRMDLRSGVESRVDTWPLFRSQQLPYRAWRATWFVAENDNADPMQADPAGFQWGKLDNSIEEVVLPVRRAMDARGERLLLNLNYIDFWLGAGTKAFSHFADPEEYAELLLAAFQHMDAKYGFVPDAVEILLEPENTPHTATDIGRAIVALVRRLAAAGYHPEIIAPSTTRMANAPAHYDEMLRVPGIAGLIDELSYHRYTGVSRPTLAAIAARAERDGIATSMLEHIGSTYAELYEDLTIANVSAWQQFTIAYCGVRDRPDADGVYFQVNQSDPTTPRVHVTHISRLLRQVFYYVRPGATRIGATSSDPGVKPLAFRSPLGGAVVVGWTDRETPFLIRGLPTGSYGVNYSTATAEYNQDLEDVIVTEGEDLRILMPAAGVVTVYAR